MKSVLRSIKPYWFYLICEGQKTIEVAKSYPKATDWNRTVELYCSKDMKSFNRIPKEYQEKYRKYLGKVGARFICDRVYKWECKNRLEILESFPIWRASYMLFVDDLEKTCLTYDLWDYGKGKTLYGWHISDLKIYDRPKELGEFYTIDKSGDDCCVACVYHETPIEEMPCRTCTGERRYLYRPPQSWMFVAEL